MESIKFRVDPSRGMYCDFFTVLHASEKTASLKTLWKPYHLDVPDEIDDSFRRIAAFLHEEEGPNRVFFLESKQGGCVLQHFMSDFAIYGKMEFSNIAAQLQRHTPVQIYATLLKHLDRNNDFPYPFYYTLCEEKVLLEKYLEGAGYPAWFQNSFLNLVRHEKSFQRKLLNFLCGVYRMVEQEVLPFQPLRDQLATELRERLEKEGYKFLLGSWSNDPLLLKNLQNGSGLVVSPNIYAYNSIHLQYSTNGVLFFVGPGYEQGMQNELLYRKSLYAYGLPLGNSNRLRILNQLSSGKPIEFSRLVSRLKAEPKALQHHLEVLLFQQFITKKIINKKIYYMINPDTFYRMRVMLDRYSSEEICFLEQE